MNECLITFLEGWGYDLRNNQLDFGGGPEFSRSQYGCRVRGTRIVERLFTLNAF